MNQYAIIRVQMTLEDAFALWPDVEAIWIADCLRVVSRRDCPTVRENGMVWLQQYIGGEDIYFAPTTPCLVSLRQYENIALKQLSLFESA